VTSTHSIEKVVLMSNRDLEQEVHHALKNTLCIIMGGGAGSRLFPLTKDRSKPAVPLGGKYRLVDIPISNCINSELRRIYVLTQFNSASLHRHITSAYKFDRFSDSFVEILAAQQTPDSSLWYQGTADAVRQNLRYFTNERYKYFLILSGDQLYRMDYRKLMREHLATSAELTIATIPVEREPAKSFGIMLTDDDGRIKRFDEKPQDPSVLDELKMSENRLKENNLPEDAERYLASMGIYLFNRDTMLDALDNEHIDFGKDIIPATIDHKSVQSFIFQDYWEDIGTIRSFYEANLNLTDLVPSYNFFDHSAPIYTHARFMPASKVNDAQIRNAIISDGCIINKSNISRCVVGVRSIIGEGSTIANTVIMGADHFEDEAAEKIEGHPHLGIGSGCDINGAIIDKNARIGNRVRISPEGKAENLDAENFYIRDGIVVIPKGAVIPNDTWI